MKILIIKIGATGDVVRTTPLLHVIDGEIHWLTADHNIIMLKKIEKIDQCINWQQRERLKKNRFDLIINLEDSPEIAQFINELNYRDLSGAYLNDASRLTYTENLKDWFDLSLISRYGKERADQLKLQNRKTYQEIIFKGLGYNFEGEKYFLPESILTQLSGDIAISPKSGNVWPMKNWAYFDRLKLKLEADGFKVNYLLQRPSILEHIGDIQNHRYLVSGDSLPMHIAMGSGIKCLSIFTCTSPWEIYNYGLLKKVVSPKLEKYFYQRGFNREATTAIPLVLVYDEVLNHIDDDK